MFSAAAAAETSCSTSGILWPRWMAPRPPRSPARAAPCRARAAACRRSASGCCRRRQSAISSPKRSRLSSGTTTKRHGRSRPWSGARSALWNILSSASWSGPGEASFVADFGRPAVPSRPSIILLQRVSASADRRPSSRRRCRRGCGRRSARPASCAACTAIAERSPKAQ